ncbi:MAG: hypothetical protein LBU43_08890 [Candidatus Accumulibacter sp.]|nr:hypothetical protein [Accumulibacter sp.]
MRLTVAAIKKAPTGAFRQYCQKVWHFNPDYPLADDEHGKKGRTGASNFRHLQGGSQIIRIAGGGLEFSGQADRTGFIGAKEIQGQTAQESEVFSGIAQTDETGVLTKRHVQTPMQAILDPLVGAHYMQDAAAESELITQRFSVVVRPPISRVDSMQATDASFGQRAFRPNNPRQSSLPTAMWRRVSIRPWPLSSVSCSATFRRPCPSAFRLEKKSRSAQANRGWLSFTAGT